MPIDWKQDKPLSSELQKKKLYFKKLKFSEGHTLNGIGAVLWKTRIQNTDTITVKVKISLDLFVFFNGHAEGSRWYYSVYTKLHEPNRLKTSSIIHVSAFLTLVSSIISNIPLSVKYSRRELECLFSSDEPAIWLSKDWEIEYLRKWGSMANYSGFVHSCINLFFL